VHFVDALIPVACADFVAYTFNDSFAAVETCVSALTPVDPLGTSGFQPSMVFGNQQTIYHFDGSPTPLEDQAGSPSTRRVSSP
jgi:hypothetical protein